MNRCPVCGQQYQQDPCPGCSFDNSRNYEVYPTLAPIPGPQKSVAARRTDWTSQKAAAQKPGPSVGSQRTGKASRKITIPQIVAVLVICAIALLPLRDIRTEGVIELSDGTYTGQRIGRKAHGIGTMVYNDGSMYEGEWENGSRHGQGTLTWDNGDIYEGQWENNVRQGQGTMTWDNGDVYEGQWEKNVRQGQGTITWDNGDVY